MECIGKIEEEKNFSPMVFLKNFLVSLRQELKKNVGTLFLY